MVEGGPSFTRLDATTNGTFGRMQLKKTFHPVDNHVWFNHLDAEGRIEHNVVQNGTFRLRSQYFLAPWVPKNTGSLRCEFITSKNLDPERQFLLGGENGLRGYSVRQFSGDHKLLFTMENRRDIIMDWLNLVSVGWAAFVDSGAAWNTSEGLTSDKFKSDVGLGLRLAPSRSYDPGLIRMDVAYALQNNKKDSRVVINIGADLTFGERRKSKFEQ
jgi:outer membrane protein assembly factor BamA